MANTDKTKDTSKENLNLNQQSSLRTAYVCAYHSAQLPYIIQHRKVRIIFPLMLWTIIMAQMLPAGGKGIMKYEM